MRQIQRVGWILGLVVLLNSAGLSWAAPWAMVVGEVDRGGRTGAVSMVDMGTVPPTVHGPFLAGQLSTNSEEILDVALAPDNSYALISCFANRIIYKVDITDPLNPVLVGQTNLTFFAEDIAMARNGQFALVTDGGSSTNVAIIDLNTFTVRNIGWTNVFANAVAIAPDNTTVLFADYFLSRITYGTLNSTKTGWQSKSSFILSNDVSGIGRPVNVTISPDGRTALAADAATNVIHVLQISSTGEVTPGITPTIFGIHTNEMAETNPSSFRVTGPRLILAYKPQTETFCRGSKSMGRAM